MPAMDYAKIAELYDVYAHTDIDVPFFLEETRGCNNVLELTSGTGRLSLPLIQAGVRLSCLDSSPEMLAVLRRKLHAKGLSAPIYKMDASSFSLPERFDMIIIPFNAFAEIAQPAAQQSALTAIHSHLTLTGRLICTLHNPAIRLRTVDGQLHVRGKFALPDNQGTLFLASLESCEPNTQLVTGTQFYEVYDRAGELRSKRFVDLQFFLHTRASFETLARSHGFAVTALYGDYERSEFQANTSPFMIWTLVKE